VTSFADQHTGVSPARYEAHLLFAFGRERHAGRNVKIKSSMHCLTRAFTAVDKNLILPQSTMKYRQRWPARERESTGRRPSYVPDGLRQGVDPSARPSTTPEHRTTYVGPSTAATRPMTAWLTAHRHSPRRRRRTRKTTESDRHRNRRTFLGC